MKKISLPRIYIGAGVFAGKPTLRPGDKAKELKPDIFLGKRVLVSGIPVGEPLIVTKDGWYPRSGWKKGRDYTRIKHWWGAFRANIPNNWVLVVVDVSYAHKSLQGLITANYPSPLVLQDIYDNVGNLMSPEYTYNASIDCLGLESNRVGNTITIQRAPWGSTDAKTARATAHARFIAHVKSYAGNLMLPPYSYVVVRPSGVIARELISSMVFKFNAPNEFLGSTTDKNIGTVAYNYDPKSGEKLYNSLTLGSLKIEKRRLINEIEVGNYPAYVPKKRLRAIKT